ncbi:MAG: sulfatase [Planctomycetota bacterium]
MLLISVDTLRRDHLGCYGYRRATSPNIDELARGGVVFENAVSTCSWTLPAHASMLTGLYPAFHGLQDDGTKLASSVPTLAEGFTKLGYHTVGVVSHVYVSREFGLERGFHTFDDSLIEAGATNPIAEQIVDRFLSVMNEAPPGRFFAFVHFFDPHWDYTPPPPFNTRFTDPAYAGPVDGTLPSMLKYLHGSRPMPEADRQQAIALYDGEIAYVDEQIGRLIRALEDQGRLENTLIAITSDHGEEFKEHGRLGHGKTLFAEQLRAPLIVAGHSAFPARSRRSELLSLIDLGPTLLDLAGGDYLRNVQGVALLGAAGRPDRVVFAESVRFGNEMRTARTSRYKLIHYLQGDYRHLYDLRSDPWERRPLGPDPTGGGLSSALADYAATADSGWHLKLISLTPAELRCRATMNTTGRFVSPRRYFSANLSGPSKARFSTFELSPDGKTLTIEVLVAVLMGEVTFETDPPEAPVTFRVQVDSASEGAGVFLGNAARIPNGDPITLVQSDPRLAGLPKDYTKAAPGCYIRAVIGPTVSAPKTNLSDDALERLRSLGYIGADHTEGP